MVEFYNSEPKVSKAVGGSYYGHTTRSLASTVMTSAGQGIGLPRIPLFQDGELLGMEKFVRLEAILRKLFGVGNDQRHEDNGHHGNGGDGRVAWIRSPNTAPPGSPRHAAAEPHGDFDDDVATLQATLARILHSPQNEAVFTINRSAASLRDRRRQLMLKTSTSGASATVLGEIRCESLVNPLRRMIPIQLNVAEQAW